MSFTILFCGCIRCENCHGFAYYADHMTKPPWVSGNGLQPNRVHKCECVRSTT